MDIETKLVKTKHDNSEKEDGARIGQELELAMKQHESVKKLIDIFFLGLFIVFIIYSVL